jgi:SDR family mycofactocin-dependent oxidoreductase
VALITGAARGQGRTHAISLAREGAAILALDLCDEDATHCEVSTAAKEDLEETVRLVENAGGEILPAVADVRDFAQVLAAVDDATARWHSPDLVIANAGIYSGFRPFWELREADFADVLNVNVLGVWNTVRAAVPGMIERREGSIILVSSILGLRGGRNLIDYSASKHAVLGMARSMALELAEFDIRVNSLHPTNVDTKLFNNEPTKRLFVPDAVDRDVTMGEFEAAAEQMHLLKAGWVQPEDVSSAALWLLDPQNRFITGSAIPVDAGLMAR